MYALPGYLTNLFMKRMFGHNEYRYHLLKVRAHLHKDAIHQSVWSAVHNVAVQENELICALDVGRPPLYWNMWIHPADLRTKIMKHKAVFVIYMLERKLGADPLQKVPHMQCNALLAPYAIRSRSARL